MIFTIFLASFITLALRQSARDGELYEKEKMPQYNKLPFVIKSFTRNLS